MPTKIEWTDETWNPITGCTKISEGCKNCYAERMAKRLAGRFGYPKDDPFRVTLHGDKADKPLKWKKPRKIFVCSMGDLFHMDVSFHTIHHVVQIASYCPQHTFCVLTKRPERMFTFSQWMTGYDDIPIAEWPRNCWIGVTTENRDTYHARWAILRKIPAAVRFISIEPMLGPVYIDDFLGSKPDWVICGAETGTGKRPMNLDWALSLRDQCNKLSIPFFFKKNSTGNHELDGEVWEQFPTNAERNQ